MSEDRKPFFYVAVGKKGIGKTYTTLKVINQYCHGNPNKPKRALIYDVNREYDGIKTLSVKDVLKFSAHPVREVRRIVPPFGMSLDDISNMLLDIVYNFREGILHIEDINRYSNENLKADLIGAIIALRHAGTDISLSFQNIGRIATPKIIGNLDVARLHKTTDDAARHKNKFEERYEIIKIGQTIVDNDYNQANMLIYELSDEEKRLMNGRAKGLHGVFSEKDGEYKSMYVYVNFNINKIIGDFTFDEFLLAIEEYIDENERLLMGQLLKKKGSDGNLMYSYEQARGIVRNRLINEYYGNSDRIDCLKKIQK